MSKKPGWAPSKQKQAWRRVLLVAQNGLCAGCGHPFGSKPRSVRSPLQQSLDHVVPRASSGVHRLDNLLLKHRGCNEARRDAPATGCDLVWQQVVSARLPAARRETSGAAA